MVVGNSTARGHTTRSVARSSGVTGAEGLEMLKSIIDFEKALELAVILSWEELVKPEDHSSIHVEYANVDGIPIASLQIWAMYKRYENLVCDYSVVPSSGSQLQRARFANAYASQSLAEALDFIMQNQSQFSRPTGRGVNGLVQVAAPTKEDRASAADWWHAMMTEFVRKAPPSYVQPELTLGTFTEPKTQAN
jgi:hypothetical protein